MDMALSPPGARTKHRRGCMYADASQCSQDCQALSTQYQKMQDEFNDGGFNQAAIQGIQVMISFFSSAQCAPIRSADHSFPTIHCGPHTALVPRH